jgi:hypothetical protein
MYGWFRPVRDMPQAYPAGFLQSRLLIGAE